MAEADNRGDKTSTMSVSLNATLLFCVLIYLAVCFFLDMTNQIVHTLKMKGRINTLVTCDCKTSNKLQCRGTSFNA